MGEIFFVGQIENGGRLLLYGWKQMNINQLLKK